MYEEDVKDKARAANCIATLFRQAQHLEPLLSHATLLPTLARVLRDDGKRSVDLCMGIQSIWLVLSNFSQFHQLLIENQVGVLTMEILDLEIKRTEHRMKVTCLSVCAVCLSGRCIALVILPICMHLCIHLFSYVQLHFADWPSSMHWLSAGRLTKLLYQTKSCYSERH